MILLDYRAFSWPYSKLNTLSDGLEFGKNILDVFNLIIEYKNKILLDDHIKTQIQQNFTAPSGAGFRAAYPHFSALSEIFLEKISQLAFILIANDAKIVASTDPNLLSNEHDNNFNQSVISTLNFIHEKNDLIPIITFESLGCFDVYCNFLTSTGNTVSQHLMVASQKKDIIIQGVNRSFEENPKHTKKKSHSNNKSDEVSELETEIGRCNLLLITAINLKSGESDKLYNFDKNIGKYIVFHKHDITNNKYHAYNPDKLPEHIEKKIMGGRLDFV